MLIRKKINLLKYFGLSVIHIGLTYFFLESFAELCVVIAVYFATVLNQWMLVDSVEALVTSAAEQKESDTSGAILMFLGKTLLLIVTLSFGVHIMGKRIIIPVLNYIIQIFILYFSFRRKDLEQ